jgi:hypothetical protein
MLFNNCRSRPQAELYGAGAFFDLGTNGAQGNMTTDLQPGQFCCVATRLANGDIEFGWYCFSWVQLMALPEEPGTSVRVFFGERLGSVALGQDAATMTEPYAQFFNVNGHFLRPSAIRPLGELVAPAGLCPD